MTGSKRSNNTGVFTSGENNCNKRTGNRQPRKPANKTGVIIKDGRFI